MYSRTVCLANAWHLSFATQVYHDYADRVFPVHRADHSWELAPNPNIPEYVAED